MSQIMKTFYNYLITSILSLTHLHEDEKKN
jgi:hypothetical protein